EHLDPQNTLTRYFHDPAGDRLQTRISNLPAAPRSGAEPDAWCREGLLDRTMYRFDTAGNLAERANGEHRLHLAWDVNQRLIETTSNGPRTSYGYDPLGRRVFKETDGVRTLFVWDGDVLIGETTVPADGPGRASIGNSATTREYVYYPQTFEPLFLIEGEGKQREVFWYHNDPNGCPTRLTDTSGRVRWAAACTALGRVATLHVAEIRNPIRLQGQYHDEETSLHYNRYRYYDPSLGSYVSADPLGLIGGINLYGLGLNVLRWADPFGLQCDILFGQRRIAPHFRSMDADIPDSLRGRALRDVAEDLKAGRLHPDQLEVKYFVQPVTGQKIAESNRTLAALSMAGMQPTRVREVPVTPELLGRLDDPPL